MEIKDGHHLLLLVLTVLPIAHHLLINLNVSAIMATVITIKMGSVRQIVEYIKYGI